MKTSFISLLIATAVLVSAAPNPRPLGRRAVSPDGGCGGSQGYSCPTTGDTCCSQWGYCGNSVNHCGAGCQAGFGVSSYPVSYQLQLAIMVLMYSSLSRPAPVPVEQHHLPRVHQVLQGPQTLHPPALAQHLEVSHTVR